MTIKFDNSYFRLPDALFANCNPVPVAAPKMVIYNHALAGNLELDITQQEAEQIFSGNVIPAGAQPLAQAYAGHQFGHFNMLGDGRAVLLGEHITPSGERFDIQLKGSGQTPFSRRGDGRAALGPMLREYIISEAMFALGVPTTRSLAVIATGEVVFREQSLQGAILARVASSHIRVGTFEYVAARRDIKLLKILADYIIKRHYPHLLDSKKPYQDFLETVMKNQAALVAKWLHIGFVHGVMNSDNVAISGETIDYGPCAFIDIYNPETVFSSIDRNSRYAYGNQPHIAHWNMAKFAEALLLLFDENQDKAVDIAQQSISKFTEMFQQEWLAEMRCKLGLFTAENDDVNLFEALLTLMQKNGCDYSNFFRELALQKLPPEFAEWQSNWQARLGRQSQPFSMAAELMQASNPAVIARNHQVEAALAAAENYNDFSVLHKLLGALKNPFVETLDNEFLRKPPAACGKVYQTFCGT